MDAYYAYINTHMAKITIQQEIGMTDIYKFSIRSPFARKHSRVSDFF